MSKITESAKNQNCQIRIPNVCNFNIETTVFCHLGGAGIALKSSDLHGSYGCSNCHFIVDGGKTEHSRNKIILWFFQGMIRTQIILLENGLIKI